MGLNELNEVCNVERDEFIVAKRCGKVAVNYRKCPKCGSCNSVKIVYGMPSFKLFQEAEAGKAASEGNIRRDNYPSPY